MSKKVWKLLPKTAGDQPGRKHKLGWHHCAWDKWNPGNLKQALNKSQTKNIFTKL